MKTKSLLLCLPLALAACTDNDAVDTTKPEVNIVTPNDDQEFDLGSEINLKAVLTDDTDLASYKIEVHEANDGHEHEHRKSGVEFSYEDTKEISGKTHTLEASIKVPEGIEEGHYHIGVFVIDQSGNQNEQFIEVVLGEANDDHDHDH